MDTITTTPTTPTTPIQLAPAERIDRFVARQLAGDDLQLLCYLHDGTDLYLLTDVGIYNVTGLPLRTFPLARTSTSGDAFSPVSASWGRRQRFNAKNYLKTLHEWQRETLNAPLSYGFTYEHGMGTKAIALRVEDGTKKGRYITVMRQYVALMVKDLDALRQCTIELLPNLGVRISAGERMLGIIMPVAHCGNVYRSKYEITGPMNDDDGDTTDEQE